MNRVLWILLLILPSSIFSAGPAERRISRMEYIERFKDAAIQEMIRAKIPASITLAQGILESANGNSPLAMYANNHFGIKCHKHWKGDTFTIDDDEKDECFRKYESVDQSFKDHSEFLTTRSRYANLFKLKITDYKGWAKGLKKAGYATNPKYADLLITIIDENKLYQYDVHHKVASKKMARERTSKSMATARKHRQIRLHNNIKYTVVRENDSFRSLANDFKMNLWQIYRYNDINRNDELKEGDIIYLQPKKNKAAESFHIVTAEDNMRSISQLYGIKLKKLYKKNNMIMGTQPQKGEKLYLKKKRP